MFCFGGRLDEAVVKLEVVLAGLRLDHGPEEGRAQRRRPGGRDGRHRPCPARVGVRAPEGVVRGEADEVAGALDRAGSAEQGVAGAVAVGVVGVLGAVARRCRGRSRSPCGRRPRRGRRCWGGGRRRCRGPWRSCADRRPCCGRTSSGSGRRRCRRRCGSGCRRRRRRGRDRSGCRSPSTSRRVFFTRLARSFCPTGLLALAGLLGLLRACFAAFALFRPSSRRSSPWRRRRSERGSAHGRSQRRAREGEHGDQHRHQAAKVLQGAMHGGHHALGSSDPRERGSDRPRDVEQGAISRGRTNGRIAVPDLRVYRGAP